MTATPNTPQGHATSLIEAQREAQQEAANRAYWQALAGRLAAALAGLSAARDFTLPDDIKRDIQEAQNCE